MVSAAAFAQLGVLWIASAGRLDRPRRAAWLQRWCAVLGSLLGLRVHVRGTPTEAGMIASNHVSYLDIPAYCTVARCSFVSKIEVKSWPIVGWAATAAGTIFLKRERQKDIARARSELSAALEAGELVIVFPESTTTDGTTVLPFRPALFASAVETGSAIQPAFISYADEGGAPCALAAYFGDMTFLPHLFHLAGLPEVHATISFAPLLNVNERSEAAAQSYAAVQKLADHRAWAPTLSPSDH